MTWRPGRSFRVGAMRYRITVQSFTSARDAAGENVATWFSSLTNEPARFIQTGGGTTYRGRQIEETVTAIFEVRYRENIYDEQQRIVFDGKTYGITRIEPVDGGRRYFALYCKAVAV